jgi:hypothetical protein
MDAQSTLSQERFMRSRCAFLAQKRLTRNCLSRRIFRQEERKKMGGVRMPKRLSKQEHAQVSTASLFEERPVPFL